MKHNILIHNLAEEDGENLFIKIPALIKQHLGVDTKFSNIHRNGWGKQDKPQLQGDLSTSLTKKFFLVPIK